MVTLPGYPVHKECFRRMCQACYPPVVAEPEPVEVDPEVAPKRTPGKIQAVKAAILKATGIDAISLDVEVDE